jgi:hypothetical protein
MKLKIVGIYDRGIPNQERLHLNVLAPADLSFHVVLDTTRVGDTVSTQIRNVYWWTRYPVQAGDWVILYTRSGLFSTARRADGRTNHFFFWGMKSVLWANPASCAVVLGVQDWETSLLP